MLFFYTIIICFLTLINFGKIELCVYNKIDLDLIEVHGHAEAKRLLYELMKDYNKLVLPVPSINQTVNVTIGLKLSQLSDIDEKKNVYFLRF
jgi:hypothetical protein